jgi:alpha-galactosidase
VPYHTKEVEMIRKAIDQCGRKIVLSTSPGETPIVNAQHVQQHANMWRTVGDFWDNWRQLKEHFAVFERWNPYRIAGGWPDGDMLPLGHIGIRAERGDPRMSAFTKDEQYTLMTLWSIFKSPLMFGGHFPDNDSFTLSILTNKDVLNVLKFSTNNKLLFNHDDLIAWVADDPKTGDKYLALFNARDPGKSTATASTPTPPDSATIAVQLKDLGFTSTCTAKDLWTSKKVGVFTGEFAPMIKRHGAGFYRISQTKFKSN